MSIEAALTDPLQAQLAPRDPATLRVCLVVPQSGPLGLVGPSSLDAALLAAHEVNITGGARGRYVDLVLVDGGRQPAAVAREVDRLCTAGAVDVVTGFHTSDVHRAVEAVVSGRTPYVFTPPHEGGPRRPGVICTGTDPVRQLRGAIQWLTTRYGVRTWALIGNDYIWPQAVHTTARQIITAASAHVVLERRVGLGCARAALDRLINDLRHARAEAVLLSLVGRDLADFNTALKHSGLDQHLVRLSGSLEENGLMASGGDETGLLYSSMSSFASSSDERQLALAERHQALLGPQAPVLDTYAESVYDGVHLVAVLAAEGTLTTDHLEPAVKRLLSAETAGTAPHPGGVLLARADGLDFTVVTRH